MKNGLRTLMSIALLVVLVISACTPAAYRPKSATGPDGPRAIVLDGDTISEKDVGRFRSWYCIDYLRRGPIVVELGYFSDPDLETTGFLLYYGTFQGERVLFERDGRHFRWDFGPNLNDYAFVIHKKMGIYYDFSEVEDDQAVEPGRYFKCYKR